MNKKIVITFVILGALFLAIAIPLAAVASIEPITSCDPIDNATPLCGWQNPEDLAALPDGRYVIVSEFGHQTGTRAGMISLLDLETETRQELYNGGSSQAPGVWGEANCVEVASGVFSPHGIHVSERADGTWQLLVVQHGGRESVEMFELSKTGMGWDLQWRGCAIAPAGSMINDVVSTPDNGFLVTHMMESTENGPAMFAEYIRGSVLGQATGHVLAWDYAAGFSQFNNSEGVVPNGIQISHDGESIFVNYSNGELRRINRLTHEIEAYTDTLPPLDNSTWTPDGRLLLAGGSEKFSDMMSIMINCTDIEEGTCPATHVIVAVDPVTFENEIIYTGGVGTPGGTGTVGLMVDDGSLLIGTFAGDRIVRVRP